MLSLHNLIFFWVENVLNFSFEFILSVKYKKCIEFCCFFEPFEVSFTFSINVKIRTYNRNISSSEIVASLDLVFILSKMIEKTLYKQKTNRKFFNLFSSYIHLEFWSFDKNKIKKKFCLLCLNFGKIKLWINKIVNYYWIGASTFKYKTISID